MLGEGGGVIRRGSNQEGIERLDVTVNKGTYSHRGSWIYYVLRGVQRRQSHVANVDVLGKHALAYPWQYALLKTYLVYG